MSISVGSNLTETVAINYSETVGAAMQLTVGGVLAGVVEAVAVGVAGAVIRQRIEAGPALPPIGEPVCIGVAAPVGASGRAAEDPDVGRGPRGLSGRDGRGARCPGRGLGRGADGTAHAGEPQHVLEQRFCCDIGVFKRLNFPAPAEIGAGIEWI